MAPRSLVPSSSAAFRITTFSGITRIPLKLPIALLHRGAEGGFAETGTPVLVIAPAETKQEAQALLQSLRETRADDAETQRLIEPFLK